jgi:iron complex outermembrane receptor protein
MLQMLAALALELCLPSIGRTQTVTLRVDVRALGTPVQGAVVTIGALTSTTGDDGSATLAVSPGRLEIAVTKRGFLESRTVVDVTPSQARAEIELIPEPTHEEEVTVVASTRTGRQIDDQPMRVEVLAREEIEEKMLMTPGDIVMMLNEMGGLRVQTTSPSLGAASVRIQGMRGRYTRFLSDGLPLFGEQPGGLGLLQIPPMDLGQVEVIKGVASALYGAGAMGGVVNLLSRRPGEEPERELLLNQTSRGGTDAVFWLSTPIAESWSLSLLGSGHRQSRADVDADGWADLAAYTRGVVRPRLFWDSGTGSSFFATAGVTAETREGGSAGYVEKLDTTRVDAGLLAQTIVAGRYVVTMRAAAGTQRHTHRFGDVREPDQHDTGFAEFAARGSSGAHTWVAGAAVDYQSLDAEATPRFDYSYWTPGVFVQDDIDVRDWLSISASARVDRHSEYGAFVSPRLSTLVRGGGWTSRASIGSGFFAPSALTEETESAGLTRLAVPDALRPERGRSASLDVSRAAGPVSLTLTVFASRISDPIVVEREPVYLLRNLDGDATNTGLEMLGTFRRAPFALTATYTYVRAREREHGASTEVALTPGHSAGVVAMVENEDTGRAGLEIYYTGRQRLAGNPARTESEPYVIVGLLIERKIGKLRLFINGENLTGVRQSRWDPVLRDTQAPDGRWTVDAWAPLDGRTINGGLRIQF